MLANRQYGRKQARATQTNLWYRLMFLPVKLSRISQVHVAEVGLPKKKGLRNCFQRSNQVHESCQTEENCNFHRGSAYWVNIFAKYASPRIVTSHQNSTVHKRNEVSNHVPVVKKWWLKQKTTINFGGEPLETPKHKQQPKSKTEKTCSTCHVLHGYLARWCPQDSQIGL